MARHPGTSFPVNHPQEAVPKSGNDRLSPSLSWSSLFWDPYKQGSGWWHYIFHVYQVHKSRVCDAVLQVLHILLRFHLDCWEDPTGWFLFLNIIIKCLICFNFKLFLMLNILIEYLLSVLLLVHPWVYPLVYLDLYTAVTAENKWSIYFILSKPVELFVHCHGPSAWATLPEWAGKPATCA